MNKSDNLKVEPWNLLDLSLYRGFNDNTIWICGVTLRTSVQRVVKGVEIWTTPVVSSAEGSVTHSHALSTITPRAAGTVGVGTGIDYCNEKKYDLILSNGIHSRYLVMQPKNQPTTNIAMTKFGICGNNKTKNTRKQELNWIREVRSDALE